MFSDGVFAVLITVLVLELRPPELPTFRALLLLWPTWVSYAVSYLFIAIVWANHHHLLRYATETTPRLMWFNFAHLFSVSLLPLSTAWMAVSELAPLPVAFYAGPGGTAVAKPRKSDFFDTSPWSTLRRSDKTVIEGYVDAAREWERIAEIAPSAHIDGRAAADFIVRAVTDHPIHRALIRQLIDALEICLESEGITWEAEHDAGIAVARARKIACL